jgi:hypothetical protein
MFLPKSTFALPLFLGFFVVLRISAGFGVFLTRTGANGAAFARASLADKRLTMVL